MFSDLAQRLIVASLTICFSVLTAGCADTRGGIIPYDRQLAAPDDVALSSTSTSNVIPAYTHLRTYVGHGPETLDYQAKEPVVATFFSRGARTTTGGVNPSCAAVRPILYTLSLPQLVHVPCVAGEPFLKNRKFGSFKYQRYSITWLKSRSSNL